MTTPVEPAAQTDFPTAVVRQDSAITRTLGRSSGWLWLLAIACLLLALGLTYRATRPAGPAIVVHFADGYGLKREDAVRYRGIDVGHVSEVRLRDDLRGVDVAITLRSDADSIACEGSRFWIERPQISLSRMSGLETVVGAKYVGVTPGPTGSDRQTTFDGLETPPRLQIEPTTETAITIHFSDGNGIAAGDVVKYRGIVIGEVTDVRLQANLDGVIVTATLTKEAKSVARKGTLFWVERAQIGFKGVRGLDTLVRGQYLALQPGPIGSVPLREFTGVEQAPATHSPVDGGLPIVLVSPERFGVDRGAVITYRGLPAGQVTSVGLNSAGHSVHVTATIDPEFRSLIRSNTQFWVKSGVDFHIGLRGVDMQLDPLAALAAGGIAFATPSPIGREVEPGYGFQLAAEETEGWAEWRPNYSGQPVQPTVGRGQRLLNRIRSPFGSEETSQKTAE